MAKNYFIVLGIAQIVCGLTTIWTQVRNLLLTNSQLNNLCSENILRLRCLLNINLNLDLNVKCISSINWVFSNFRVWNTFLFSFTKTVIFLLVNKEIFSPLKLVFRNWKEKVNKNYLTFKIWRFKIREYPIYWWDTYDISHTSKYSKTIEECATFLWNQ